MSVDFQRDSARNPHGKSAEGARTSCGPLAGVCDGRRRPQVTGAGRVGSGRKPYPNPAVQTDTLLKDKTCKVEEERADASNGVDRWAA